MDRGGEPLETYILVPLPKHKTNEQKLKRAEEIIATSAATPPPQLSEKVAEEEEEQLNEASPPPEMQKEPSPPPQPKVGKNQTQAYRRNQIKKFCTT